MGPNSQNFEYVFFSNVICENRFESQCIGVCLHTEQGSKFALDAVDVKTFKEFGNEINGDGGNPEAQQQAFEVFASGQEITTADLKEQMAVLIGSTLKDEEAQYVIDKLGSGGKISLDDFKKATG